MRAYCRPAYAPRLFLDKQHLKRIITMNLNSPPLTFQHIEAEFRLYSGENSLVSLTRELKKDPAWVVGTQAGEFTVFCKAELADRCS